jgi:GH25 family lysozyme M1 (1,4-beta-N-acetylmuramidase)
MPVFGLDISHHQDLGLDLAQCRREGIEFVFIKATEGANFVDSEFTANLAEARRAGQLVAAYHYVRASAAASDQVAWIRRCIPRDVPVIPDVEANSGGIALTRDFINRLRAAGYRVPLLYLPRWYWNQIGSPSLAGLPPLWSSRYPDTVVGSLQSEWNSVPTSYWSGYGGLEVAVLQFTSSARIAGHAPLDANAFRGDRARLAALLGGEEDVMAALTDEQAEDLCWRVWAIANGVATYPQQQGIPQRLWGKPAAPGIAAQNDDEAKIVAAVQGIPKANVDITPEQLADLADAVVSAVPAAAHDAASVAIREAFARAGTPSPNPTS